MLKLKLQDFGYAYRYFDAKSWLSGKDPDAGKDWGQEEKRMTESELLDGQLSEIVKDREAWDAAVHRVTKSWI